MIFIRPKILRNSIQTAFETNAKYNMIRDVQQEAFGPSGGNVQLMRGVDRPILPPLEELQLTPPPGTIDLRKLKDENPDVQLDVEQ